MDNTYTTVIRNDSLRNVANTTRHGSKKVFWEKNAARNVASSICMSPRGVLEVTPTGGNMPQARHQRKLRRITIPWSPPSPL
jgi:hypothetical protein